MLYQNAVRLLRRLEPGTRVVIRFHLPDGSATDALGDLRELTATSCTVLTKRGEVAVSYADVIAAKQVPPAPAPRPRRTQPLS